MPLLQNIRSLFSRKKYEKSQAEVDTPEAAGDPAPASSAPPDNVIYIYSHGFTNGVYRIEPDKDSFEQFLEHCNRVDRIKELRLLNESVVIGTEVKLNAAIASQLTNSATVVEKEQLTANISVSITELEQQRLKKEQKESALNTQAKETVLEYAWVPALFYLLAGFTFIAADISITKQITSWGFDMKGWQSWVFAVGLAFTAFLIKPTVDRLLEKPFQAAGLKLRVVYKAVLLGITVLGLVMLYCLGKFRADSEIARNKLNGITAQMSSIEVGTSRYKEVQSQYDEIQKSLDENSMGQSGIIMSGMLFAIGGAVCLSIAFGALKPLINRYWILPIRIQRVKKELAKMSRQLGVLRSAQTALIIEKGKAEKLLEVNDVDPLKQELAKLWDERVSLLSEFYEAQRARESALYIDGKNKGAKYQIEGDLVYAVKANDQSALYLGKQNEKGDAQSSGPARPYTRRPFVKLRKMIADNFNKNQHNLTNDGSEFEILS